MALVADASSDKPRERKVHELLAKVRPRQIAWTAGAYAYLYPGAKDVNYVELVAQVERPFGPVTLGAEVALAPRQDNVSEANRYLGVSSAYDSGAGWTVTLRGGYEDGFYDRKLDWEIGASYTIGAITASVAYVGTNHGTIDKAGSLGEDGFVGALVAEF